MTMNATITRVNPGHLLVIDSATGNEVRVNTPNSNRFSVGDNIEITYPGMMTASIPPQISATNIRVIRNPQFPFQTRAVVVQRNPRFLIVNRIPDNRRIRVNYAHARHFCVGQRIIISHNPIFINIPREINAINIVPIC